MKKTNLLVAFLLLIQSGIYASSSFSSDQSKHEKNVVRAERSSAIAEATASGISQSEKSSATLDKSANASPENTKSVPRETLRKKSTTGDVLGYISFGLGLFAATFGLLSFLLVGFSIVVIMAGIAGIIVGAIGKSKKPDKKGFANIGILCSILGIVLSIAAIAVWIILLLSYI